VDVKTKAVTLVYVTPPEAPALWPKIERYVQEANNYGGGKFAVHQWLGKVLAGQADLFVSPDLESAAICESVQYPLLRVYCIVLIGGEGGHDWDEYQKVFEDAAKVRQCDVIETFGRAGWKPVMKRLGYDLAHFVWRKEVR